MILFIEKFKDVTRKLLELINESGKVAGYKINVRNLLHSGSGQRRPAQGAAGPRERKKKDKLLLQKLAKGMGRGGI